MSPKVFEEGIPQGTQRFVGGEGFLFGRYENCKIPTKIPCYVIDFVEPDPGCACPIDFKCVSGDNWNLFFDQKISHWLYECFGYIYRHSAWLETSRWS